MSRTPIFLPQLTLWMSQNTDSNNRWGVKDISNATGISDQTLRRLLNGNPEMFIKTRTYPFEYFYLPCPTGQKIIDRINAIHLLNSNPAQPNGNYSRDLPASLIPDTIGPVAKDIDPERIEKINILKERGLDWCQEFVAKSWSENKLSEADSQALINVLLMLETITELIESRIEVLTRS